MQHLTERLIEMEQRLEREADARRKIQAGIPLRIEFGESATSNTPNNQREDIGTSPKISDQLQDSSA